MLGRSLSNIAPAAQDGFLEDSNSLQCSSNPTCNNCCRVCRAEVHNKVTSPTKIKESGNLLTAGNAMPEIEGSLLQADLSKQLSKIGRSTNYVLPIRERCLPSKPEHRELRRIQQADRASEQHQLSGTEEQILAFDSNCVHLPSKNNVRDEKRVNEMPFLSTIYENVTWSYSNCFEYDKNKISLNFE